MYKRILVPLDGSKLAERVLPHAERLGAELMLLKVLSKLPEPSMAGRGAVHSAETVAARLAEEYLEGIAERLKQRGATVQAVTREGRPYVEIVRYAEKEQVDLIVLSTRGQSGLSRWLLGSVADRVVRGATVPLLLIPARVEEEDERA